MEELKNESEKKPKCDKTVKKEKSPGVISKSKEAISKTQDQLVQAIDQNGDGVIDIEDVIIMAMKTKGVKINRKEFLEKELMKNYDPETIRIAVENTPSYAKIPIEDINKIADEVIKYERTSVTGISAALGVPGGVAMVATIPADIAQYYGFMLRCAQKLLYLYGFPEIDFKEDVKLDAETMNILILCMGVMYGVSGASNALKAISKALAKGVEKKLMNKALTKGTIYPMVKKIASWFGVHMTKKIFSQAIGKAIPVAGGVIGGAFTWVTFKPCCEKLKNSLQDTLLTNPDYKSSKGEFDYEIVIDEESED